eukprot:5635115-Prymnesium_polylepis.1
MYRRKLFYVGRTVRLRRRARDGMPLRWPVAAACIPHISHRMMRVRVSRAASHECTSRELSGRDSFRFVHVPQL